MADLSAPKHTTSTASSRRTDRALAEARQAGTAAPEVDSKTGKMINPHNPEFITKRPWYLGGGDGGASLEHQAVIKDQKEIEREALGMGEGDRILEVKRTKALEQKRLADSKNIFTKGMWVESLYNGKKPYQMAYVLKVNKKKGTVDLRFDDRGGEIKVSGWMYFVWIMLYRLPAVFVVPPATRLSKVVLLVCSHIIPTTTRPSS